MKPAVIIVCDLRLLLWIILICTAGREAFGLVRYAFLGGDPQNAYANLEGLNIKITFWDINDSIIAALIVGFCGWKLLAERVKGWEGLAYSVLSTSIGRRSRARRSSSMRSGGASS